MQRCDLELDAEATVGANSIPLIGQNENDMVYFDGLANETLISRIMLGS